MARKRGMQFIPYDYEAAYNKAMFYIHARMRKRRLQSEKTEKTGKTCRTT